MSTSEIQLQARPDQVAARLTVVRREISQRFVEIGELLLEAHRGNYAQVLGYASFDEFVKQCLDMSPRRARYLADCFKVLIEDMHVSRDQVAEVGWSRAKEILPVVTTENVTAWMDRAASSTTSELNLAVRQSQAPPGQADALQAYSTFGVGVFDEERVVIERAIELCKLEGNTPRTGLALFLICQEYVGEAEARQAQAVHPG